MAEVNIQALEQRLANLQSQIDVYSTLTDHALIRTYVAEAALAFLIAGQPIDFDQIERLITEEFDDGGKRLERAKAAVAGLRLRTTNPTAPQND
ncbi:hypothetical protein [uncultured Sphingomonas sp.]|uniref:hypothetical protein n=1 Tax=uncultured Sphingomonas sp. TaxID=158754 RepID=UPI0025E9EAAF|nr:hypothetical protein [uncultured Sphingomonas sp.]